MGSSDAFYEGYAYVVWFRFDLLASWHLIQLYPIDCFAKSPKTYQVSKIHFDELTGLSRFRWTINLIDSKRFKHFEVVEIPRNSSFSLLFLLNKTNMKCIVCQSQFGPQK